MQGGIEMRGLFCDSLTQLLELTIHVDYLARRSDIAPDQDCTSELFSLQDPKNQFWRGEFARALDCERRAGEPRELYRSPERPAGHKPVGDLRRASRSRIYGHRQLRSSWSIAFERGPFLG